MLGKVLKLILILIVIGFFALLGYAYFGDLSPVSVDVREPVELNVD